MVDNDDFDDYSREELIDFVVEKMDRLHADEYNWEMWGGRDNFADDVQNFSDETLRDMAERDLDEFTDLANFGFDEGMDEPPDWLLEMGWYDDDGDWHNPFWYH